MEYQWYEDWEHFRKDDSKLTMWDDFSSAFLDHFFPQELRESKTEEFVNLKQGRIIVKEYALEFH